jgi:hypothetical protein
MKKFPRDSKGMAVPNKRIGLFRRGGAMFSNLWETTCFLRWAEANKLIPVIDFQTHPPVNRKDKPNSDGWADYFEPVSSTSLSTALADPDAVVYASPRGTQFPVHEYSQIPEYCETFGKYIRLNPMMAEYVALWSGFLEERGPTLGVHARGTDMRTAKSHLAPPENHQLFRMVDKALERTSFDSIFVASEDERSLSGFVKRYGSLVVTTDSFRTTQRRKLSRMSSNVLEWRYVLGMQVIRDTWLLARCHGLVSGSSNVSEHAQVINGNRYAVNYQIRRPRVDIAGSSALQISVTNALRFWTTSRFVGPDFKIIDRSAG